MTYRGPERRKVDRGGKPLCPSCGSDESKVIDSGIPPSSHMPEHTYLRRRECPVCGARWKTGEQNLQHTTYGLADTT